MELPKTENLIWLTSPSVLGSNGSSSEHQSFLYLPLFLYGQSEQEIFFQRICDDKCQIFKKTIHDIKAKS